jgi:hypothetical protein
MPVAQIALSAFVVYSGHFDSIKNGNASQLQRVAGSLLLNELLSHVPSEEFCIRRSSNFLPIPIVESLVYMEYSPPKKSINPLKRPRSLLQLSLQTIQTDKK